MTAMLKQFQSNPPSSQVKAVEEICITCGGAHPYYQCLAASGNTFPEYRDNIQGYVYHPQGVANQMRPPGFARPNVQNNQNRFGQPQGFNRGLEKIKRMNDVSLKAMQNQIDMVKNELRNEMKTSIQTSLSSQTNEIKNMMASLLQMNTASTSGSRTLPGNTIANPKGELKAITTRIGLATDGPTIPNPPKSVNPAKDECVEETITYSATSLLEEFADELALITYPSDYDDNHSIDQSDLTHCDDLFVDPTSKMFTDEQPPDYSFPPRFDVYPDDFLEIESDADTFDDDSFDSKGEKIKESELLIDRLDLPCDILSEYDSFNSQNFSRDDVLPSPDNEDKVFNPGILFHEKSVKIITRVTQEKKRVVSYASLLFEDFDPPFYGLLVFKSVPNSIRLHPFSSENEEKVFKPGIYTSKKHTEEDETTMEHNSLCSASEDDFQNQLRRCLVELTLQL
nr:hypothetical protein [Tanacetum cinerariifolium]